MFVNGILSAAAQLARLTRAVKPAGGVAKAASAAASPTAAPASDAMRQIAADYDVTSISPRAFSEMLQKLRQAGTLSDKDYQDLSAIRADLEQGGSDPDQRINLVDLYTKKLAGVRGQSTAPSAQRQLDWLQKFARLRAGQGSAALDAMA
jgi:hypothetical protein